MSTTGENMAEFEDSQEFNKELALTEYLSKGDYQAVDRLIGDDPAMARKAFQNYRGLKSLDAIKTIEKLSGYPTEDMASAKPGNLSEINGIGKSIKDLQSQSIREIVISYVKEGIDAGLQLISGEGFVNAPVIGATRSNLGHNQNLVGDSIHEMFSFSHFNISKAKSAPAHDLEASVFLLTIPYAQKVKVRATTMKKTGVGVDEKMIYQGKRVNHLELPLASGGYEINIDDEVWRLVLA